MPSLDEVRRDARTIYANDELAFPGIAVFKSKTHCDNCEEDTIPIAVESEVAASLEQHASNRK